jgi:protein-tyrosine phosphatase
MTATILFLCRANLCRSPSAEVMLARALSLHDDGAGFTTRSAGMTVVDGQAAPDDFVEIALIRGIDLREHRPVAFSAELGRSADLILTMTRDLLRGMVVNLPEVWPRSFTLLELVRRGTTTTPPLPHEGLAPWIARVHAARDRTELLGADTVDDLRDPMVDAGESNEAMFGQLERATRRLARLLATVSG